MSSQPRRSLRLRSSNLPEEPIETDKSQEAVATAQKRRAPSISNPVTKSARTRKKAEENEAPGDADGNENEAVMEEEKPIEEKKAKSKTRQPRKRGVKEESEEEEAKKEKVPAKTRRTGPKTEEKENAKEINEDKKKEKAATVLQSNGRPRRGCVRKTTVEKYEDLMSGSASSSDVTSSESEVDDSDLEKEIEKAKRRRGGGKGRKREVSTHESSSESNDDEEGEEEDEDMEIEEPVKKRGRSRGGPSSSRAGGCSGRRQRPKMEMNELPVQILHDRQYHVDYDEMVAWEAKSVKMVRDLRELERDRANGGLIMDTLNEFIQGCLKGGRMAEMEEKESIRLTHVHEAEVEERNRRKKMTMAQRIKEQVQKEKQRLEEEESGEDEEEDEWEEMEPVEGKSEKGGMQVRIDTKKKLNAPWKAKWIRQEVNREVRQRCENIHKIHLLSYIAHMRHLMALAKSTTREDGGIPLSARALSLLPSKLLESTVDGEESSELRMEEMKEWWRKRFTKLEGNKCMKMEGLSESERLDELMETGHFETSRDAAVLFSSLASHLHLPLRIVARCLVVTKTPKENTAESKKGAASKGKKVEKEKEDEKPTKEKSMAYWCELWNKEENKWKVFDPFLDSCEGEKKANKKGKKKEEEKINEIESWKSSSHSEPFHSCMEKDGPVLYFIAVDNDFCVRDVSSRYINGKDMISRELRGRRANEEWLMELWQNRAWAVDGKTAKNEEEEWMEKMKKMNMPTTVTAFKDHPLYVLDKDVLKMQIIFPYDTEPIGEISKYKIYLRKFVRPINTPKWYEKMGRQIKKEEPPCGEKQVTNPMSGETGTQGLYGYWQTEPWDGGEIVEGRIPRNEFGNVYLYQPQMVPRGCIYLVPEGLQRVAAELKKDFVPAVIAWYYKGGSTIPLIRGAVFIKEDVAELISAWKVSYKRWKEDEKKTRTDRCMGRWKKLIKGMLRLAAMRKEFEPMDNRKKGRTLDEEAVQEEEKASWPQKKYGGEMFQEE